MKRKLLFLFGLLAFCACSDDKSVDGPSSERLFFARVFNMTRMCRSVFSWLGVILMERILR